MAVAEAAVRSGEVLKEALKGGAVGCNTWRHHTGEPHLTGICAVDLSCRFAGQSMDTCVTLDRESFLKERDIPPLPPLISLVCVDDEPYGLEAGVVM